MHPAKEGFSALPFFDEFDLSTVDILLISQYVGHLVSLLLFFLLAEMLSCPILHRCFVGDGFIEPLDLSSGMTLPANNSPSSSPSCIQEAQYNSIHLVSRVPNYLYCVLSLVMNFVHLLSYR
jgi:hypothetical protein